MVFSCGVFGVAAIVEGSDLLAHCGRSETLEDGMREKSIPVRFRSARETSVMRLEVSEALMTHEL